MTTRIRWLLVPLLLAGAPGAQADEPQPSESEVQRGHVLVAGKLPEKRDEELMVELTPSRPTWMDAVHIEKGSGFALRQSFRMGKHDVILGVKGPVMKRKRLGLSIEVRF